MATTLSARQAQIVDAALHIIATEGARRFTAQMLADRVGLTGGALYRHFASMEAVVGAVVELVGETLFAGFPPEAPDPIERLRLFFHARARAILEHPDVSRLLLSDHLAHAGGPAQARRLEHYKLRSQAFVVDCLKEASAQGLLCEGTSPEAGAVVVLGSVLTLSHVAARLDGAAQSERLFEEVWSAIERMLKPGPCRSQVSGRGECLRPSGSPSRAGKRDRERRARRDA